MAQRLKNYEIKDFSGGYNAYSGSKILIKPTEIPVGQNTALDANGSAIKRAGLEYYGGEIVSGHPPTGITQYKTTSKDELIVACDTGWYKKNGSGWTLISGKTFSADKPTFFVQALDRLYGCNGTDTLCYYDGTNITDVGGTEGKTFTKMEFAFNRLWGIETANPAKVWFSNTFNDDGSAGNFGTYSIDLNANPVKNAGSIEIRKGAGTELVDLRENGGQLWIMDKATVSKIPTISVSNPDNTVSWPIDVVSTNLGGASPYGTVKTLNDFWLFSGESLYTNGEVAQFQSPRTTPQSGRIQTTIQSIAESGIANAALGYYKQKLYFAYQTGTYNDRVVVLDTVLNAWTTPYKGWNIRQFLTFDEGDSDVLLGLSANESYVYRLEVGVNDNNGIIEANFESQTTSYEKPGLVKRTAWITVFYGSLVGEINYEVSMDDVVVITGTEQIASGPDKPVGIGSQLIGTFLIGNDFDPSTTFVSTKQNGSFEIDCGYEEGRQISVKFSNEKLNQLFKISKLLFYYIEGSPFE